VKIRRFVARDMRTALAQIKDELGADAVIMSNKKIPEGIELMAAIDYSQSVPEVNNTQSEERQITNDVVNLGLNNNQTPTNEPDLSNAKTIKAFGQNIQVSNSASENSSAPADSLSALLNRQVQHDTSPQKQNTVTTSKEYHQRLEEGSNIGQQLRSFTERLRQSTPDGNIPAPESQSIAGEKQTTSGVPLNKVIPNVDVASVSKKDFDIMQKEMASIRQILEHQVSGLMWQDMAQKDPQRAVLYNKLIALGLSEQISDQIAGYVPTNSNEDEAWQQALKLIATQINTTKNDIIHRGGVVALVGPTGVGKTTTIAKLAARFAQIHGSDQVALISTDTYRIAGFEQLSTYGKIIGCQVKLAKDSETLDALIQQFSQKKLILIDTAGMGQRDLRLVKHLTTLVSNSRVRIRNYLVLAANSQQQVMQENVDRFRKIPLSGCIYTKLDESVSIGEIISTSIHNGLSISYLTDGQRVPEDIKVANADKLVILADKMATRLAKKNISNHRAMPIAPVAVL